MAAHSGNVEATPTTKWGFFKIYIKHNPLVIWPLFVIVSVAITKIFFISDPLYMSLLSMITVVAMGLQWLGIVRTRRKVNKQHWEFDEEQIDDMFKMNEMGSNVGMGPQITFLVPYKMNDFRRHWYKLTNKRVLALFDMGTGRSTSYTKYLVDEKGWFFLKLRGCIGTTDSDVFAKGKEYLKDHKRVVTIL